LISPAAS
jgi:hypothetical protein